MAKRTINTDYRAVRAKRSDVSLHVVEFLDDDVHAICMTRRVGRSGPLKVEPLFVHIDDVRRIAEAAHFGGALNAAKIEVVAAPSRQPIVLPEPAAPAPEPQPILDANGSLDPAVDRSTICIVCGVAKTAIEELGVCPRKAMNGGQAPTGCAA